MNRFALIFLISSVGYFNHSYGQIHSVLSAGTWYKFAVSETGVYSINGSDLDSYGISIADIEPSKIRLFGQSGGMLPQANNASRPQDLEELAIKVMDGGDNSFDPSDKILFWAEGSDEIYYDENLQQFSYKNNVYSDTSYYFLNLDQAIGKRIEEGTDILGSYPIISSALTYYVHEIDEINILKSGRAWYGEKFDSDLNQTFSTSLSNWVSGSSAKIYSSVMASSFEDSKFTVSLNGNEVGIVCSALFCQLVKAIILK